MVKRSENLKADKSYDIIFLDLDMPILNGFEACTQITDFFNEYIDRDMVIETKESLVEKITRLEGDEPLSHQDQRKFWF